MGNTITIGDSKYTLAELKRMKLAAFPEGYSRDTLQFLKNWWDTEEKIEAKTSGSTGNPKRIQLSKKDMNNSALATGSFFQFKSGDRHYNPLPAKYIAGKMMLVRAMTWHTELHVVQPSSNPLTQCKDTYAFGVMTPHQLAEGLASDHRENINNISTILLGGSPVNSALLKLIKDLDSSVYLGYGMTETMSHVALKKLNGQDSDDCYRAVYGIHFSQDERDCLVIHTEHLSVGKVVTNDIVHLIDSETFEWKGRYDNVVNSGGIKLFPEQIEAKISPFIDDEFYVVGEADDLLGERLVLKIEGENSKNIEDRLRKILEKYEMPKAVHFVERFERTENGKVRRI